MFLNVVKNRRKERILNFEGMPPTTLHANSNSVHCAVMMFVRE
jgi:hypothetical protein